MINISGLNKAALLAALWSNARSQIVIELVTEMLGHRPQDMTAGEAQDVIDNRGDDACATFGRDPNNPRLLYFDYLMGCPMKVDLKGEELDERWYDDYHGEGAAARVVAALRAQQSEQANAA